MTPVDRRLGDRWLGRAVKIITVIGAFVVSFGALSQGLNAVSMTKADHAGIDTLKTRVSQLETSSAAVSYMTCVNFAETHKASEVPTYCNTATRGSR